MVASVIPQSVETLNLVRSIEIAAPIDIVFEATLAELGPGSQLPDGSPFPMKIEPWPGGRWFRDLGNNAGHLWGHVQVIKPPKLLEICGPMFMSYAASVSLSARVGGVHAAVAMASAEVTKAETKVRRASMPCPTPRRSRRPSLGHQKALLSMK